MAAKCPINVEQLLWVITKSLKTIKIRDNTLVFALDDVLEGSINKRQK